jgi:hypothetical protein
MRGNEVRFCLLNFPHQACRGKLEDKEIFCFQLNFLGKFRRQKSMHGHYGSYAWVILSAVAKFIRVVIGVALIGKNLFTQA